VFTHAAPLRRGLWLTLCITLLILAACSEEGPTTTAGNGSLRIESVTASSVLMAPGDSVLVSARVVTAGPSTRAAAGVAVSFGEAGHLAHGVFTPASTTTDAEGWARAFYRPQGSDSGRVDLKASAGSQVRYVSIVLRPRTPESAPLAVALSSAETALPADGHATLDLRVRVTGSGLPLAGRSVRLVAGELFDDRDHDGRFSTGDALVIDENQNGVWDAIGQVTSPVVTGPDGSAIATYTAGGAPGAVYVKATVDSVGTDLALQLHTEEASLVVQASPAELWADGLTPVTVEVRVSDSRDLPLAGKLVRFTAGEPFEDDDADGYYTPGTDRFTDEDANGVWDAFGTLPSAATTGADGSASITFVAGHRAGTATLYASTRERRGSFALRLMDLPRVARAEWSWSSDWVYANGLSATTLNLRLYDNNGSPIPGKGVRLVAGEPFTDANGNGVFDPGVDTLGPEVIPNGVWDALGRIPTLVYTDANGSASAVLIAPAVAGSARVKASAGAWSLDAPIDVRPLPELLTIDLVADRDEICLIGSGGEDRASVTARGVTVGGETAPAGIPIVFEILSGPAGGETFEGTQERSTTALTDAGGEARAVVRAGSLPGALTVTATRGPVTRSIEVGISVGPAAHITAHAADAEIGSWAQTAIDVALTDAFNNPVKDGTVVYFETDEGLVQGTSGPATSRTAGGRATATYYSLGPEPDGDGRAEIVARAQPAGVSATVVVRIPVAVPTVRIMEVEASPAELTVKGVGEVDHALIRAACFTQSQVPAPAGMPVSFEIVSGPGGDEMVNEERGASIVQTDAAGVATALLTSGTRSGPMHVRVTSGTIQRELYLGISAGPPAWVYCSAAPLTVTENPPSAEVTAVVSDAHNNPVPDGTVVYFGVDLGFVFTVGGSATAATSAGVAKATYQALIPDTSTAHAATVSCSTEGAIGCQTLIALPGGGDGEQAGPIARIELVPSVTEIAARGTGWTEQCAVVATAYDSRSRPVGSGRSIAFEILAGPGGGEAIESAGYGPVSLTTDANGQASVTLSSGTASGTVRLEASANGLATRSAMVSIAAGPPVHISLGIDPLNIRGWDAVGVEAAVTAIVSDTYNNPVSDGTTIYFTCDEGIIRGSNGNLGSAVTAGGIARATYLSGLPRDDGRVVVTASTAGGTVLGTASLIVSGPAATVAFVAPTPPVAIPADGESELQVTAEVLDGNGNFVVGGMQVHFTTTQGTIDETATTADGVYGSLAQATLRSATLARDFSWSVPDDGVGAMVTVTARAGLGGAVSDALAVAFSTGPAYRGNSRIDLSTSVARGSATPFDILIRDRYGNPLGGHVIGLTVSGGGSVTASGTTDGWGTAGPLLFNAPASDTTCVITAIDGDPGYGGLTLTATVAVQ
jgi:hypothetical protein